MVEKHSLEENNHKFGDHNIEVFLGNLLRWGVSIAASVVLVSGIIYLFHHANDTPHYHSFKGESSGLRTISQIFHAMQHYEIKAYVQLGVLLLIATPIARVFFSIIGFLMEKDILYIVITLIVLAILLTGIFSGLGG